MNWASELRLRLSQLADLLRGLGYREMDGCSLSGKHMTLERTFFLAGCLTVVLKGCIFPDCRGVLIIEFISPLSSR
jgi:hypothetical protein